MDEDNSDQATERAWDGKSVLLHRNTVNKYDATFNDKQYLIEVKELWQEGTQVWTVQREDITPGGPVPSILVPLSFDVPVECDEAHAVIRFVQDFLLQR